MDGRVDGGMLSEISRSYRNMYTISIPVISDTRSIVDNEYACMDGRGI